MCLYLKYLGNQIDNLTKETMMNDEKKKTLADVEQQIQKQYQQRKNCFLPGQVKDVFINGEPESLAISPKWEGRFDFKAGYITSDWRYDPIVNPESGELSTGIWMGDLCALMDIEQQLELASWLLENSAVGMKVVGVTKNSEAINRFTEALEKHLESVQKIQIEFNEKYHS
ncbi:MAG: hypothetical protein OQL19_08580 [Gammaproteobacteria bacterium]|nr:hypothetical protein [Gammaproteobacteria bacterium]